MILTEKQIEEFKEASKPMMKFLCDNFNPHVMVHVDQSRAEICFPAAMIENDEFVKD